MLSRAITRGGKWSRVRYKGFVLVRRQYGEARLMIRCYQRARSRPVKSFHKGFQTYKSEQVVKMAVRFHEQDLIIIVVSHLHTKQQGLHVVTTNPACRRKGLDQLVSGTLICKQLAVTTRNLSEIILINSGDNYAPGRHRSRPPLVLSSGLRT